MDTDGSILKTVNSLNNPNSVSVNSNPSSKDCWVAEYSGNQVSRLDTDGNIIKTITGILAPVSVSVNPNTNECWVAELMGNRVSKIDKEGNIVWTATGFSQPVSVAVSVISTGTGGSGINVVPGTWQER